MDEALIKRVLPHSIEAEQSVIGSMLMDKDAIPAAVDILNKEDFYSTQYGIMYECMVELYNEAKPIDLVTVQNRLREKDVPPEVASLEAVKDIINTVPTSANIKTYAGIVHDKAVMRRLIRTSEDIANTCYAGKEPLDVILEDTEKNIFHVIQQKNHGELVPIGVVAETVLSKIEKASKTKEKITGISTGFSDLDYMTSGFQPSDLVLIAARPSMGKTALVLNIVRHVAMKKKRPCMVFSLEMSKEQLVNRVLSMESDINSQKLRTGELGDADWEQLVQAVMEVSRSPLVIDDTPGITVTELRSKCRKVKLEKGLDLIVIDYLQLMSGSSKRSENRQQEVSEISRNLKAIAREMECPVIALSQLSRAPDQRPDHRPQLSDLRESGAIEQDADIVMFIYRDERYNPDTEHPGEAELIVAKQRNGPTGTVNLVWKEETTKFVSMAKNR
ncbi:MAG: replicative DNA helicase [Lachnospiraceae bacterium]|nr:replicative DNA helicase [Candidatus Darwinimomas equi]